MPVVPVIGKAIANEWIWDTVDPSIKPIEDTKLNTITVHRHEKRLLKAPAIGPG